MPSRRQGARNRVRIIGGEHRGRVLAFPDLPGLRPTADRVRETLFNWLAPLIEGARCLDLFAGSGALGFEAVSRGAREVVMIEAAPAAARQLQENAALLGAADRVGVVCADALRWLEEPGPPFDIVFLDPPFAADLSPEVMVRLSQAGRLSANARIYLEQDARRPLPPLPPHWRLLRDKSTGQVAYRLLAARSDAPA